jgi:hypothetical protein
MTAVNEALYQQISRTPLVKTLVFLGMNAHSYILLARSKKMIRIDGRSRVREFNLLKPKSFFTYYQVLTFKNSTWCSLSVECFVRISEHTMTFALYVIK